jgi:DNA-binding transcriptional LysR family regulator
MPVEFRQLEHFIAVAEEGHFTRAAERLLISQSGLSASIRSLERELGAALFHRNTRQVSLTAAGRALLGESRRTMASMAAARDAVASVQGLLRGTLSVGAEQCLGAVNVPELLARFRASHPGVEIILNQAGSSSLVDGIRASRLDLAFIGSAGNAPDGVDLVHIADEPMVMICRNDDPLAARTRVPLAELRDATFVDFASDWGARQVSDRAFASVGIRRQVMLEVNDVHTLLDLVGHGLGIAIVPAHIARKKAAAALAAVDVEGADVRWSICVAIPPSQRRSPAACRMIEQLAPAAISS